VTPQCTVKDFQCYHNRTRHLYCRSNSVIKPLVKIVPSQLNDCYTISSLNYKLLIADTLQICFLVFQTIEMSGMSMLTFLYRVSPNSMNVTYPQVSALCRQVERRKAALRLHVNFKRFARASSEGGKTLALPVLTDDV
jgi:hypothetical protein